MLLVPSIRFRFRFITPRFPVQILCIYTTVGSRQLITAYSQWNLPRFFRRSGFVSATLLFIVCMNRNTITYDKRWLSLMGKSPRLQSPLHASL